MRDDLNPGYKYIFAKTLRYAYKTDIEKKTQLTEDLNFISEDDNEFYDIIVKLTKSKSDQRMSIENTEKALNTLKSRYNGQPNCL